MSDADTPSDSCFIDTNVWLYAFVEDNDPSKAARAKSLIRTQRTVYVSTQVINEVCVNLLKQPQFPEQRIQQLIESFYANYAVLELSKPVLLESSSLRQRYSLSFWDSVIVSSALHTNAEVLYSEDMQDGLVVDRRLRIINPFKKM